ncbi:HEAT repeat domain-containing protein [Haloarcula salina]|uniref:HEAT repeat domain-containing protein n=1 Tax=Haloarcula salina TaxID=1429914 RepID=A0AA41KJ65_9EURY|nr:HEAT repeat domain-containing protein [Haloarcula salina]MBV0903551.1 HEAT repeat domain-containing protein [Haloarcula salina]
MEDTDDPTVADRLVELLERGDHEAAAERVTDLETAATDERKAALRSLRTLADSTPEAVAPLVEPLTASLTDEERAVRLSTAKLFVAVAERAPDAVVPAVSALASRLGDDEEFYYVRARAAEALGYVAVERSAEVASPEVLADLRVGLALDEPEVREKLAKALECVALGDPARLRHRVSDLAQHLTDDRELVRYHLTTALVAVGCEHPDRLRDARDEISERLDDESASVRGRAAEALGLAARADSAETVAVDSLPDPDDADPFVAERVRFAARAGADAPVPDGEIATETDADSGPRVGTLASIRETTEEAATAIASGGGEAECRHCGLGLPTDGPPLCPRCGAPR